MKSLHAMVHEAAVHYGTKTAAIFDTGSASPAACLSYDQLVALGNELCRNVQGAVGENEQAIGVFCDVNIFLPVWIFRYISLSDALNGQKGCRHLNITPRCGSSLNCWKHTIV